MYKDLPLAARMYLQIRVRNYPKSMWTHMSDLEGTIVSVGAGYALLEGIVALRNPRASVTASDVNRSRIDIARTALARIPNLSLDVVDLRRGLSTEQADGFLLIDVLHHLTPDVQEEVLGVAARSIRSGGRVLIKECGTRPAWKKWVNYLNDAIGSPFQRTYPRDESEWAKLLSALGLICETIRLDRGSPYAHILIEGRKR
ncbi:MAG: class I SAM-dependent methyltransferase [Acidobacteriota bacterium]|nr:class I SAM-dependent methyltransferase [Acidobacteriota bacterium]